MKETKITYIIFYFPVITFDNIPLDIFKSDTEIIQQELHTFMCYL